MKLSFDDWWMTYVKSPDYQACDYDTHRDAWEAALALQAQPLTDEEIDLHAQAVCDEFRGEMITSSDLRDQVERAMVLARDRGSEQARPMTDDYERGFSKGAEWARDRMAQHKNAPPSEDESAFRSEATERP